MNFMNIIIQEIFPKADASLNALNQIVAYFNLLKVYEKLLDEKLQKISQNSQLL